MLLAFLLGDLAFSFWQYFQFPLDGDMAPIVGPDNNYASVLHDPFGLRALLHHEVYAATNRFFAHFCQLEYFRHVPLWLQAFLSPVDSLYTACALLRLACHTLLVYGLAAAVSNRNHVLNQRFLLAAALVTPLLQASGFYGQMGVVDQSISYACAYALPQSLLLLFFLPFLQAALHGAPPRVSALGYLSLAALAVVLAFNGPTVAATALLVCPAAVLALGYRRFAAQPRSLALGQRVARAVRALPTGQTALFAWLALLSLYSVYIGRFNSENLWAPLPLAERYVRLPLGVVYQIIGQEAVTGDYRLAGRFGLPLLLTFLFVNAWFISQRLPATQGRRVRVALRWLGLFALVYLLLLPLGGYREYRHYIVRRDTVLPVLIALLGGFALSTNFLLGQLRGAARWRYIGAVVVLLVVFTIADKHRLSNTNACERQLFAQLAAAPGPIVRLPATCSMIDWQPLTDYRQSELKGQLLAYWGIINEPKLYYQQ
ncbi:hypothetical protein ACFST9_04950 [Hymenobacter monticola]|uniref:YfhO family protein n=1 Tax=Hymenobacter monticola TaxID=1705399 RepID=A0ABY4BB19_9BACT|nr:hypothetical protein [Hymenobacter monticola]UOE35969.1 hypothetical protein MTP16_10080 [Hymenobacter monticola]